MYYLTNLKFSFLLFIAFVGIWKQSNDIEHATGVEKNIISKWMSSLECLCKFT